MKRVILLLSIVISVGTLNAQVEVRENTTKKDEIWKTLGHNLYRYIDETDTSYTLFYRDAQYSQIVSIEYISFNDLAELNQFLDLVEKAVSEDKEFITDNYRITQSGKFTIIRGKTGYCYFGLKYVQKVRAVLLTDKQ